MVHGNEQNISYRSWRWREETVKHMKDTGILEAEYITFGKFEDDDERKDISHYNLITMNGHCGISPTNRPGVFKHLAENVEDDIREILKYHMNKTDSTEEN